ncbi:MAG: M56 family metallopeptidase [Limisphaerales bacterium]
MNTTWTSFLGWLLRSSWQAAILTVLVLLAQLCLRQRLDGRWRHLLWLLVLARLAIPFSPPSPASLFNYLPVESAVALPQTVPAADFAPVAAQHSTQNQQSTSSRVVPVKLAPPPALPASARARWTTREWSVLLTVIWAMGAAILVARIAIQSMFFRRRLRREGAVVEPPILELLDNCKSLMRVRKPVRVIETDLVESPALFGFFQPKLLLPKGLTGCFALAELRHIFLHELAHVRRRDMAVQWLGTCFQIVHWFNPVLWFGFQRMAADRELACDELALSVAGESERQDYGRTIVKLLENFSQSPALPGLVGILEDKGQIMRRILMIAGFQRRPRWSLLGAGVAVALGVATLTGAQTKRAPEATPQDLTGTQTTNGLREQAWEMVYVISAKFKDPEDRWRCVKRSVELLRDDGLGNDPNDVALYRHLSWIFQHKMGSYLDDAHMTYKLRWAQEMEAVFRARDDFQALENPRTGEERERARKLREVYKMDPALVRKVDETYGPFDWRLPDAHAVYWAELARLEAKPKDQEALRRSIYQSMRQACLWGALDRSVTNVTPDNFILLPNLDLVPKVDAGFEEMIAATEDSSMKNNVKNGHKNFLKTVVPLLYQDDQVTKAAYWFDVLKTTYPNPFVGKQADMSMEDYAISRIVQDYEGMDMNKVAAAILSMFHREFIARVRDQDDKAVNYQNLARQIWNHYTERLSDNPQKIRQPLEALADLRQMALDEELSPSNERMSMSAKAILRTKLGLPPPKSN